MGGRIREIGGPETTFHWMSLQPKPSYLSRILRGRTTRILRARVSTHLLGHTRLRACGFSDHVPELAYCAVGASSQADPRVCTRDFAACSSGGRNIPTSSVRRLLSRC